MPVKKYSPKVSANQTHLISQLTKEWRSVNSKAKEPVILEESDHKGNVVRVYVIWSEWSDLDRATRGEIIMDAAEKVKKLKDLLKITVAMGLTPEEADRFGIAWRSEAKA
jgi:hypothetical protein